MTSIDKIESYLFIDIEEEYEAQVNEYIDVVTAYIERYTGRKFAGDGTSSTRVYDGTGDGEIIIDDAIEVIKVEIDGQEVSVDSYYLYPANTLPKTRIIMPYRVFRWANQNVKVTAKWGHGAEVPEDLSFAATVMVSGIINSQDSGDSDTVKSESIGAYSVTYATGSKMEHDFSDAKRIIKQYKRYL